MKPDPVKNPLKFLLWCFGNDEDGLYGAGTKWNPEGKKSLLIFLQWTLIRNPVHNFTHHVIGIYGEPFETHKVYENVPGWSKSTRVLDNKHYPYWNYQGHGFQFYFGWRKSGAFGISFRKRSED